MLGALPAVVTATIIEVKGIWLAARFLTFDWTAKQLVFNPCDVMEATALRTTHHTADRSNGRVLLYHRRRLFNALVLAVSDGFAIFASMIIAGSLRSWLLGAALIPDWTWLLVVGWCVGAFVGGLLPSWGLDVVSELRRTVTLLVLLFCATALFLFLVKKGAAMSRLTLTTGFVLTIPLVPLCRMLVKKGLIHLKYWGVPAVVYGIGGGAGRLIRALREEPGFGYVPVGVFDDDPDLWGDHVEGVPVLGSMHQSAPSAPVAVLVASGIPQDWVASLLEGPLSRYKQTVVVPDLFDVPSVWVKSRNLAGILGLEITSNLLDPLARFIKRTVDLTVVVASIPVWAPLYVVISILIRMEDGGPSLFLQERVGKNGRTFQIPKFRTMTNGANDLLENLLETDPHFRSQWNESFKLTQDPRITRVGSFLRRWSLDELPQLVSVLRGEMSLVGPRPLPQYHVDALNPRIQELRARVRPGMTGQWQVSGRSDVGNDGMARLDAFYVRNWSVWLDIVILVRTASALIKGAGAY